MKSNRTLSIEELKMVSRFESLQETLLSERFSPHLDKPLAYWALPSDRRLPLVFLDHKLKDLLSAQFNELASTPGIGRKKMCSFVKLLSRAANTDPSELSVDSRLAHNDQPINGKPRDNDRTKSFDPSTVSEVTWNKWQATVVEHGFGSEILGRFASSLVDIPRVIWSTTLDYYLNRSLSDIRGMKIHGEKRVAAVLAVFREIHLFVSKLEPRPNLKIRIVPQLIDDAEQWIGQVLRTNATTTETEIFDKLISPLLEQFRLDAAEQLIGLAENRLGISGPIVSVRELARDMKLTRARVYQLLDEINDAMVVRWPTGRQQMLHIHDKFLLDARQMTDPPNLKQLNVAIELFFPGDRRGLDESLEGPVSLTREMPAVWQV